MTGATSQCISCRANTSFASRRFPHRTRCRRTSSTARSTLRQGPNPSTVDPFEIVKAEPPLRGRVVDESDQPVAGAIVRGVWEQWLANFYGVNESLAITDSSGSFQLERIPALWSR